MTIVVRRFGRTPGYSNEFIEAYYRLAKTRSGYIPVEEVQRLADMLTIVEPLPKLLPPLPKLV